MYIIYRLVASNAIACFQTGFLNMPPSLPGSEKQITLLQSRAIGWANCYSVMLPKLIDIVFKWIELSSAQLFYVKMSCNNFFPSWDDSVVIILLLQTIILFLRRFQMFKCSSIGWFGETRGEKWGVRTHSMLQSCAMTLICKLEATGSFQGFQGVQKC